MSKPIVGSLPYNPQKPTLILQRKAIPAPAPNVAPQYRAPDGNYYKTPLAINK